MKILSPSISRPVWMCLFWTQGKIFWRMWDTEQYLFLTMEVNGDPKQPDYTLSSEYLPLCSEQTHSYRSGNTWGWVNDDRISIFGWAVPLNERWGERSIQTEGWRHCLHGQGFYARFVFVVYLHSEMITDERRVTQHERANNVTNIFTRVWNRRKKTFSAVWEYMWELYGFLSTPNLIRDIRDADIVKAAKIISSSNCILRYWIYRDMRTNAARFSSRNTQCLSDSLW